MHHPRLALRRILLGLGLAALALAAGSLPSSADLIEDRDLNYVIEIPNGWSRLPAIGVWEKLGIVAGAERKLGELKTGKAAKGEGAQIHLAITDAPADKTLDDLAADPEVRGFLLNRFAKDAAGWPEVEVISDAYEDGLEIRLLRAKGRSPNLSAKASDTHAVMLLTIARGRLFKFRMYAWHTEFDEEGLKGDLDLIEVNFYIPDTTPLPTSESEGERPPPPDEPEEPRYEGDAGKELPFQSEEDGWSMVKPVGIQSFEWDAVKYPDVVAWFQGNDHVGSYQVIVTMIRRGRIIDGRQTPDPDIRSWAYSNWWTLFTAAHPEGAIQTYPWPRRSKSFLTMPDFEDVKMVVENPERRPIEADVGDLIKKLHVMEKVKNQKLGREKTIEGYRGVMMGLRPNVGREVVLRYAWGTPRLICQISISLARDAPMKWGEPIRNLLESIEMTGRPR